MAKRFTATEKWQDRWFRSLSPHNKLMWIYMLDNCNHAGIFEVDLDLAGFQIGEKFTDEEFFGTFGDKVQKVNGSKVWIPNFINFQYQCRPDQLNPKIPPHRTAIEILTKYGLCNPSITTPQPLSSPYEGAKDKDKDKDEDEDKSLTKNIESETGKNDIDGALLGYWGRDGHIGYLSKQEIVGLCKVHTRESVIQAIKDSAGAKNKIQYMKAILKKRTAPVPQPKNKEQKPVMIVCSDCGEPVMSNELCKCHQQ